MPFSWSVAGCETLHRHPQVVGSETNALVGKDHLLMAVLVSLVLEDIAEQRMCFIQAHLCRAKYTGVCGCVRECTFVFDASVKVVNVWLLFCD